MLLGPNISQLPHAIINPAALYSPFCLFFFFSLISFLQFLVCHFYLYLSMSPVFIHTPRLLSFSQQTRIRFFSKPMYLFSSVAGLWLFEHLAKKNQPALSRHLYFSI